MIVETKVRRMMKLALYDEKKTNKDKRTERYTEKAYLTFALGKGALHGTIAYVLALLIVTIYMIEGQYTTFIEGRAPYVALFIVITYLTFMVCYMWIVYRVYHDRYYSNRKDAEEYLTTLHQVNDYYNAEENNDKAAGMEGANTSDIYRI